MSSRLASALTVDLPLISPMLTEISSRDLRRQSPEINMIFPFQHSVRSVERYDDTRGEMRKVSTRDTVMRQEKTSFLFFHLMLHVQSMRVVIGIAICGMLMGTDETMIFRVRFLTNGESSRSSYRCQEKPYQKR